MPEALFDINADICHKKYIYLQKKERTVHNKCYIFLSAHTQNGIIYFASVILPCKPPPPQMGGGGTKADTFAIPSRSACSFQAFTAVSGSSSEEGCTDTNAYGGNILNPFTLEKGVASGMDFLAIICCF